MDHQYIYLNNCKSGYDWRLNTWHLIRKFLDKDLHISD